jgi:hypothetical protein
LPVAGRPLKAPFGPQRTPPLSYYLPTFGVTAAASAAALALAVLRLRAREI